MKIIVLAAGRGERLYPLTLNTPKPLLDMGTGKTLIEEQLDRMRLSGVIHEVVLVIGYLAEQVEAKMATYQSSPLKVRTLFNPFYALSNNLMSLWLALHEMDEDFLITNGDNLFAPDVFERFVKDNEEGIFLSINLKQDYDEDDMKVTLQNKQIIQVSKTISPEQTHAESPGLILVRGEKYRQLFRYHLEKLPRQKENLQKVWLEVFNSLAENGVPVKPWVFEADRKWQEVDFHMDLAKVKQLLQIKIDF